jgi:hypothetical protein
MLIDPVDMRCSLMIVFLNCNNLSSVSIKHVPNTEKQGIRYSSMIDEICIPHDNTRE